MKKLIISCSFLFLIICALLCMLIRNGLQPDGDSNNSGKTPVDKGNLKELTSHPIVIYIPGFLSGDDEQIRAKNIIRQTFPKAKSVDHRPWCDVKNTFDEAVIAADAVAKDLASEIANWKQNDRNRLILIGHSLGGRVVIRTLDELNSKGMQIRQAILLGAAIDNDDSQIEKALLASKEKVISIVNPTDKGLKNYITFGGSKKVALGTGYVFYRPDRLHEIQTEASVEHDSCFYLERLLSYIDKKKPFDTVIVPQVEYNEPVWMDEDDLKDWNIEDKHSGWRLLSKQNKKNIICRIVDDLSFIRASGASLDAIKRSFAKVKKQLDDGLSDGEIFSNQEFKVDIPQFDKIVQKKGSSKELDWETIQTIKGFDGWRLQQNGRSYRILDPACNVRSYIKNDKKNQMSAAFDQLKIQLFKL